jgi:hypothetical protein
MSTTNAQSAPTADGAADPAATLFSFWTRWMEQSARGTQAMLEAFHSATDLQHVQRNVLDPIARSIEEFMRTPAFMEAMKRNLKAATDAKLMQDQVIRAGARQVGQPTASDITGLFDRLQSTEQAIIARLQAIDDRLKAVEDKLSAPSHSGSRRTASRAADEAAST